MATQFQYPEQSWAQGRMRKRGEKLAMMPEADPTQTKGLFGAGSIGLPGAPQEAGGNIKAQIADQLSQIREHANDIAVGDATMGGLKKLIKKLGWSHDEQTGTLTAPDGSSHPLQEQQ